MSAGRAQRTVIRSGWLIAYADGGHILVPGGVVVIDGDRVTAIEGAYDGHADLEIDARTQLVCPGFIDTHVHIGTRATHRLIADAGRKDIYGQPFLHWALTRPGSRAPGDLRFKDGISPERNPDQLAVTFTVAELLRNGTTTFLEIGSRVSLQELAAEACAELGVRAYLGPGFQSEYLEGTEAGRWERVPAREDGWADLRAAADFIRRRDGDAEGLIRGLLVPRETEFCSPELLRATSELREELGVPIQIHAAYSPLEWQYVVERYGCTPIEFLDSVGLLGPGVMIGHGQLVAENPLSNWAGGRDLEILAERGSTVAHSPVNIIRRGRSLDSFDSYRRAGVNIALGTDTYPRDMIEQMRMASYMGKVMTRDFTAASAGQVFEAATLGGARALERDDLGRIAPGSKADIAIIALRAADSLRHGVVRDPVQALVDCGVADDVETVLVDGRVRMRDRVIPGLDLDELLDQAQAAAERYWSGVQSWDPWGRPAEELSPWSFPLRRI
jgi:5-methylthioadenosine/S-adenosylhomocysteine deaminase